MLHRVFLSAAHMMSVCQALKDEMTQLGVPSERVSVMRNGVDLALFSPSTNEEQIALKQSHKLTTQYLAISVGWLIERKGHHLIIEALQMLPDVTLAIAGSGPDLEKRLCFLMHDMFGKSYPQSTSTVNLGYIEQLKIITTKYIEKIYNN